MKYLFLIQVMMFNTMNIHFNTCLLLVQPMKNHPDITENVLTGTSRIKSSKQTSILVQTILGICQACICLQTEVFVKLLLYFYRKKVVGFMRKVYVYFSLTCA